MRMDEHREVPRNPTPGDEGGNGRGSGGGTWTPPPQEGSSTTNLSLVRDFADVILKYEDSDAFSVKAKRCADYVKVVTTSSIPDRQKRHGQPIVPAYDQSSEVSYHPHVSVTNPQVTDTPNLTQASVGSSARKNLFIFMTNVSGFATRAKNVGFSPPDNPFVEIARLNSLRSNSSIDLPVTEKQADDIIFNIQAYVDLLEAYAQGAIDLNKGAFDAAQLEHVTLSYSGLGGTGNNAADLMRLLPDADEIKAKKAAEALSILNFSKRVPKVIFTAEYMPSPSVGPEGVLIGWKKMSDAGGYIVKRHAVIDNSDIEYEISNEDVAKNDIYMDYAKSYALTFYDNINPESVCLFLDRDVPSHEYFIYRIAAYQTKKESTTSIVPSDFIKIHLDGSKKILIINRITELDPGDFEKLGEETISPWPVVAEQILGDASLDWILAAANTRDSINRGDTKAISRKYSYLNAHVKFLLEQADQDKLVRPNSISDVRDAISSAISTYGVMQTIEALLQETGVLYYFDGRDARDDTTFDRAGTLDIKSSGVIGAVAAAIDPESATIDLKALATNLATILSDGKLEDYTTTLDTAARKAAGAKPQQIDLDPSKINDSSADSGVQYVSLLGEMDDTIVDLTTFDGLSKFMRVIRVMSDFGPNRIPPEKPTPVPDPEPPAPPAPVEPPADPDTTSDPDLDAADRARRAGKPILAERIERNLERQNRLNDGGL